MNFVSVVVWLLIAMSLAGVVLAAVWWRRGMLARRHAALFAVCAASGGIALLLFATRLSDLIFQQRVVAIDLVSVITQTGLAILGLVLGFGIVAVLIWVIARFRSPLLFGALCLVLLFLSIPGVLYLRAEGLPKPTPTPTPAVLKDPSVIKGFKITRFSIAAAPTTLTVGPDGTVYWAEYLSGNIMRARDDNGVAKDVRVFASGFKGAKGLAFRPNTNELYVSLPGDIVMLADTDGDGAIGAQDTHTRILTGLGNFDNEHSNNGIAFGPDGKLYIAVGGPRETQIQFKNGEFLYNDKPLDPLVGGILVADADGKNLERFAKGMRNPYDVAFDAQGRLFATDNGTDAGANPAGDELNLVMANGDYGYPEVYGYPPPWSKSIAPLVAYRAHASPDGVVVYQGEQFPKKFRGNVFVAIWSDSERLYSQADVQRGFNNGFRGSKIDRVTLVEKNGHLTGESSDFAWDFDHPLDVTAAPDGSLFVADFTWKHDTVGGAIYKIEYVGN